MIFVTIGSMFPFDRLIRAVDLWASRQDFEVFAQIGNGGYEPLHMSYARMLTSFQFNQKVAEAELVVAHAGMGSVISAAENGKPIVLLPRSAAYGEHNNDHQRDTARRLGERPGVFVAHDVDSLHATIDRARKFEFLDKHRLSETAPENFVQEIRKIVFSEKPMPSELASLPALPR